MLRITFIISAAAILLAACAANERHDASFAKYPNIQNIGATQQQIDERDIAILTDIRPADGILQGRLLQALWLAYEAANDSADPNERFGELKNHWVLYQTFEDKYVIWLEWRSFPINEIDQDSECTGETYHCYGRDGGGTAYQVTVSKKTMSILDITPIDP